MSREALRVHVPQAREKQRENFEDALTSSTSSSFLKMTSVRHLTMSVFSCSRSDILIPSVRVERSKFNSDFDIAGVSGNKGISFK